MKYRAGDRVKYVATENKFTEPFHNKVGTIMGEGQSDIQRLDGYYAIKFDEVITSHRVSREWNCTDSELESTNKCSPSKYMKQHKLV